MRERIAGDDHQLELPSEMEILHVPVNESDIGSTDLRFLPCGLEHASGCVERDDLMAVERERNGEPSRAACEFENRTSHRSSDPPVESFAESGRHNPVVQGWRVVEVDASHSVSKRSKGGSTPARFQSSLKNIRQHPAAPRDQPERRHGDYSDPQTIDVVLDGKEDDLGSRVLDQIAYEAVRRNALLDLSRQQARARMLDPLP